MTRSEYAKKFNRPRPVRDVRGTVHQGTAESGNLMTACARAVGGYWTLVDGWSVTCPECLRADPAEADALQKKLDALNAAYAEAKEREHWRYMTEAEDREQYGPVENLA